MRCRSQDWLGKHLEVVMNRPWTRPYSQARGMTSRMTTGVVNSTTSMAKPVLMAQYSMLPTDCTPHKPSELSPLLPAQSATAACLGIPGQHAASRLALHPHESAECLRHPGPGFKCMNWALQGLERDIT